MPIGRPEETPLAFQSAWNAHDMTALELCSMMMRVS